MKKTQTPKLTLSRESLCRLHQANEISQVAGGAAPTTTITQNTCVTCFYC